MISMFVPVFFRDLIDQLGDDGIGALQVAGQQQFGFVVDALEQEGHGFGECVALRHQQQPIEFAVLVAGELHVGDLAAFRPGRTTRNEFGGVGEDFRQPPSRLDSTR
jgi:hypothetical protein